MLGHVFGAAVIGCLVQVPDLLLISAFCSFASGQVGDDGASPWVPDLGLGQS